MHLCAMQLRVGRAGQEQRVLAGAAPDLHAGVTDGAALARVTVWGSGARRRGGGGGAGRGDT